MVLCFAFGQEPWLLPPALNMIQVLKSIGHKVDIIYAEYQGKKPEVGDYDSQLTYSTVPKQAGFRRLLTFRMLNAQISKYVKVEKPDCVIACDILSLQATIGLSDVKKGYWGFEIIAKPDRVKYSFDYYRALRFPAWVNKLNFFLAPSISRLKKIEKRVGGNVQGRVIYNCRQLIGDNHIVNDFSFNGKKTYSLIYTGMISKAQYIEEIVDAMFLLPENISLSIAGPADEVYYKSLLLKVSENRLLKDRVHLLGRLSREDAYDLVNNGDIGFVFYNPGSNGEANDPAPNKLSDYIAGRLWILGSNQEYIKYWLQDKGAGLVLETINKESIAKGVMDIISDNRFNNKQHLENLYLNELNMNVQADILLDVINNT